MTKKKPTPDFNGNDSHHIVCEDCALYPVCEPTPVGGALFDITELLLLKRQPVQAGETIYREGEAFEAIYALTTGSAKEVCYSGSEEEQVLGFKLKGELAGQNGIATGVYPHTLIALEDSTLCILPYDKLQQSAQSLPQLSAQIIKLLAVDSNHESQIRRSLATAKTAEGKVRAFIHNIASRYKERNLKHIDIKLSMKRKEIADYLGITKETLSRSLTSLQRQELIETSGKHIHIINFDAL